MTVIEHNRMNCMDVADVIALEQHLAATGTSLAELMNRAGSALAEAVEQELQNNDTSQNEKPESAPNNVLIFAGSGNNGGDGWVAARILGTRKDLAATLVTPLPACDITAEPAHAAAVECEEAIQAGSTDIEVLVRPQENELSEKLAAADIVVDAMLGTGFNHSDVREPLRTWIELINAERAQHTDRADHSLTVIAADCPSGLNAQTGSAASTTITADITVTMLAAKTGMLTPEAHPYVGKLLLAPLGQ